MEDYLAIIKEAREQLIEKENTISVKDLALCHRKKVFSVTDPVPMSDAELYNYVSGQAAHDVLERHFMIYPHRFKSEMEVVYKQVRGKIDIYDKLLNNVLDIKSSKLPQTLLRPFKFHEDQVRSYVAMTDAEEGQVIYQMNHFGRYHAFPIYMTAEERKRQLEKLESESKFLLNAISVGDPSLVKGIYRADQLDL